MVAALMFAWPSTAAASTSTGELDAVRSEVSGGFDSDSSDSDSDDDWSWDDDDETDEPSVPGSRRKRAWANYRVPYSRGRPGVLTLARTEGDMADETPRRLSAAMWGEGAWAGRGLWRSGGGLRVDGQLFGADVDLSYYFEPKANDALYLGTANVNLMALRLPRVVWRMGMGVNTMIDGRVPGQGKREYALGWNTTTSAEIYPVYPFVLSMRFDGGWLYKAPMVRARATAGLVVWRFEIYGGYEHNQVGRVGLGGPTLGLRLWL